jgi:hypothetical protein
LARWMGSGRSGVGRSTCRRACGVNPTGFLARPERVRQKAPKERRDGKSSPAARCSGGRSTRATKKMVRPYGSVWARKGKAFVWDSGPTVTRCGLVRRAELHGGDRHWSVRMTESQGRAVWKGILGDEGHSGGVGLSASTGIPRVHSCGYVCVQDAGDERERLGAARQSRWLRRHGLRVLTPVHSPMCA